jgi:cation diffusion facilitator CzcD-associated flavoprotein CzcO
VESTTLLVIGAGPYGLSAAACARDHGVETIVLGQAMGFWRDHMPAGMLLRSDTSWHLDAAGSDTMLAYLEGRGIRPEQVDPIPLDLLLAYSEWFIERKRLAPRADLVVELTHADGRFEARLESGARIAAEKVIAAPGHRFFQNLPAWAGELPAGRAAHTCEAVRFEALAGARVLIVGGRQSAYEWAALIGEAGAERIDLVHRHDVPRFERVSWEFINEYVQSTMRIRGWWRSLAQAERDAIARRFWEAGRLTLEYWLAPRLERPNIHRWPRAEVVETRPGAHGGIAVALSNGERLEIDHVIFASGYKVDFERVPYLAGVRDRIVTDEGFPVLGEAFDSSLPGLYLPGFVSTRDFGPFFGFVKGSPAAATMMVENMARAS